MKNIVFLPVWGSLNETIPQQQMAALRQRGAKASYGLKGTFFPLTRSARKLHPDLISLDWIHQYTLDPFVWKSVLKSFLFILDVLLVRYGMGVRLVWTLHNLRHHDPRPRGIEQWISRFFARHCEKVRILGKGIESTVATYLKIPPEKIAVIPEGPYIGWYPEGQTKADARKELGLTSDQVVWLYLGTLRPYKGVENLMEAFLKRQDPNLQLLVAGNPWNKAYTDSLIRKAGGHPGIRIVPESVPDEKLQTYFGAADLVVLPFRNVLNSGSVLLAMGFGKAVVAPRLGLIPFRLSAQPELLFSEDRPLEEVLEEVSGFPASQLEAIGSRNRQEALKYNWDDFARFILSLL